MIVSAEHAMDDVMAQLWKEDSWSGRTKEEFRANERAQYNPCSADEPRRGSAQHSQAAFEVTL